MPPWSQSGKSTYLSWLDPTNIYATALTDCSTLVGGDGTDPDYDDIKLLVRHYSNVVLNQGFAATAVLAHDLKSDSHYLRGIDYDELGWLYTALEAEGIYKLTTYGEALAEYRAAHQATYPTSAFAVSAYDSMVTAGHDQFRYVWWTLP